MKMKNKYMGGGLNKRSMYEKGGLSKAQKKMDKNNNNKIDSEDLAMLRKAEEGMKMKYQDGGVPLKKKTIPQEGAKLPDTDKLSFKEAFDFYRNELGGGSRFMWKGKPYSTSTPEELLEKEIGGGEDERMKINIERVILQFLKRQVDSMKERIERHMRIGGGKLYH